MLTQGGWHTQQGGCRRRRPRGRRRQSRHRRRRRRSRRRRHRSRRPTAAAAAVVAQDAGDGSSSSAFQAADPAVRTQVPPSRTVALHGGWLSKVRLATFGITSRDVRPNEVSPWRTRRLLASTLCLRPRRSNTACHAARTPARCRINIYLNPQCRCWHPAACHTARSAAGCTTSTPSVDAGAQQHVIQLAQQQGAP